MMGVGMAVEQPARNTEGRKELLTDDLTLERMRDASMGKKIVPHGAGLSSIIGFGSEIIDGGK
jgi:hypothetical protein